MAGTLVLTDTIQKTFDDLFSDIYDDTDAVVRAQGAFDSAGVEQRGRVDASLLDTVSGVDGVDDAQPDIRGYAQLVDKDGDAVGDPENGPPTLGGNWIDSEALNGFTISDGSPPRADDEVVIDKKSADDTGYQVGDTAQVLVKGGPQDVTIAGIATFGDADSPGGASFVLFTLDAAQRLIAEPDKFDNILVVADDGSRRPRSCSASHPRCPPAPKRSRVTRSPRRARTRSSRASASSTPSCWCSP